MALGSENFSRESPSRSLVRLHGIGSRRDTGALSARFADYPRALRFPIAAAHPASRRCSAAMERLQQLAIGLRLKRDRLLLDELVEAICCFLVRNVEKN